MPICDYLDKLLISLIGFHISIVLKKMSKIQLY